MVMPVPVVTGTVDEAPLLLLLQMVNSKDEPTFAIRIAKKNVK
jgi:hypothetical protein